MIKFNLTSTYWAPAWGLTDVVDRLPGEREGTARANSYVEESVLRVGDREESPAHYKKVKEHSLLKKVPLRGLRWS